MDGEFPYYVLIRDPSPVFMRNAYGWCINHFGETEGRQWIIVVYHLGRKSRCYGEFRFRNASNDAALFKLLFT